LTTPAFSLEPRTRAQQMLLARVVQPYRGHHVMPGHFDAVDVHGPT